MRKREIDEKEREREREREGGREREREGRGGGVRFRLQIRRDRKPTTVYNCFVYTRAKRTFHFKKLLVLLWFEIDHINDNGNIVTKG